MPSDVNLDFSGRGTFSAGGLAQVQLGPLTNQESWNVRRIIVSSDSVLVPTCAIYKNRIDASQVIATTASGNNDTDYQENLDLAMGENLYAVWLGGTPGRSVTVTVQGTKTIAGMIYQ